MYGGGGVALGMWQIRVEGIKGSVCQEKILGGGLGCYLLRVTGRWSVSGRSVPAKGRRASRWNTS